MRFFAILSLLSHISGVLDFTDYATPAVLTEAHALVSKDSKSAQTFVSGNPSLYACVQPISLNHRQSVMTAWRDYGTFLVDGDTFLLKCTGEACQVSSTFDSGKTLKLAVHSAECASPDPDVLLRVLSPSTPGSLLRLLQLEVAESVRTAATATAGYTRCVLINGGSKKIADARNNVAVLQANLVGSLWVNGLDTLEMCENNVQMVSFLSMLQDMVVSVNNVKSAMDRQDQLVQLAKIHDKQASSCLFSFHSLIVQTIFGIQTAFVPSGSQESFSTQFAQLREHTQTCLAKLADYSVLDNNRLNKYDKKCLASVKSAFDKSLKVTSQTDMASLLEASSINAEDCLKINSDSKAFMVLDTTLNPIELQSGINGSRMWSWSHSAGAPQLFAVGEDSKGVWVEGKGIILSAGLSSTAADHPSMENSEPIHHEEPPGFVTNDDMAPTPQYITRGGVKTVTWVCPHGTSRYRVPESGEVKCRQCINTHPLFERCPGDGARHLCGGAPPGALYTSQGPMFSGGPECDFACSAGYQTTKRRCAQAPVGEYPVDGSVNLGVCTVPSLLPNAAVPVSRGVIRQPVSCAIELHRHLMSITPKGPMLTSFCSVTDGGMELSVTLHTVDISKVFDSCPPEAICTSSMISVDISKDASIELLMTQRSNSCYTLETSMSGHPLYSSDGCVDTDFLSGNDPGSLSVSIDNSQKRVIFRQNEKLLGSPALLVLSLPKTSEICGTEDTGNAVITIMGNAQIRSSPKPPVQGPILRPEPPTIEVLFTSGVLVSATASLLPIPGFALHRQPSSIGVPSSASWIQNFMKTATQWSDDHCPSKHSDQSSQSRTVHSASSLVQINAARGITLPGDNALLAKLSETTMSKGYAEAKPVLQCDSDEKRTKLGLNTALQSTTTDDSILSVQSMSSDPYPSIQNCQVKMGTTDPILLQTRLIPRAIATTKDTVLPNPTNTLNQTGDTPVKLTFQPLSIHPSLTNHAIQNDPTLGQVTRAIKNNAWLRYRFKFFRTKDEMNKTMADAASRAGVPSTLAEMAWLNENATQIHQMDPTNGGVAEVPVPKLDRGKNDKLHLLLVTQTGAHKTPLLDSSAKSYGWTVNSNSPGPTPDTNASSAAISILGSIGMIAGSIGVITACLIIFVVFVTIRYRKRSFGKEERVSSASRSLGNARGVELVY